MHSMIKLVAGVVAKLPFPNTKAEIENYRRFLNDFEPKSKGECVRKNSINIQYDLHIIIPAYNAEEYIRECLDSVL